MKNTGYQLRSQEHPSTLKRTKNMFLIYGVNELIVQGYTDSSFKSNKNYSKSYLGFVFTLDNGAVSCKGSK